MKLSRIVLISALLAGIAALATGLALYAYLELPQGSSDTERVVIEIPPGSSAREVGTVLEDNGIVAHGWLLARILRVTGLHREVKAGEYAFELPVAPSRVIKVLHEGQVLTVPITVPEGLTLWETAAVLAEAGVGEEQLLVDVFLDPSLVSDLDPDAASLEGYLFPETYRFAKGSAPELIAGKMVQEFRSRFAEARSLEIASASLSLRDLVTLASLVEKETGQADEREAISGVYVARLERRMLMQCDPTIIYAKKLTGSWDGNIRRSDLTWDHPYNTYVRPGLPPGPIASPGLASLDAALSPKHTGALYFVARGDGGHAFSKTLAEHNQNVRRYQLRRRSSKAAR